MPKNAALALATIAVSLALLGCAAPPPPTLYQRLGGHDAIAAVVDDAVTNVAADPRINQRFSVDALPRLKKNLADLICLRTGGPCTYTGKNMSEAHEGMHIRDDEFDALAEDIVKSLDKFKVPAREQGELMGALGQMRNAVVGH
jgi:hemoglobin